MKKILYTLLFVPLLLLAQNENPCYSINDIFIQMDGENPSLEVNLVAGWNMIGYPCTQDMLLTDGFSSIDDKISMVKNNNGAVYIPEFNFNGIGFLESGQGYQVKMTEFVMDFSFCESVKYPNFEGCTDCEASNFNQLANLDDGSCNYDSDGDGVPDSEEVVGCQDSLACDYNINATDSEECTFTQVGYDCEGNLLIYVGAEVHGGIVFYYDSIGDYGLVAALEDLTEGATDPFGWGYGYGWGCSQTELSGADGTSIGTGYQNTIDIVLGCSETPIAASEALAYESEGYSDWYLPSYDELLEMYNTIGNGGLEGNIGGFQNFYYWSSSEYNNNAARAVSFSIGTTDFDGKGDIDKVRVIRSFGNWTMGCMDSLACNYNPEANMGDGSCEYPELGYDCEGNIVEYVVGMEAEGGIVFYVDSTGERGLVAAMEDLEGTYHWGCYQQEVNGADETSIGSGYQNTLDIVSGCSETPIAASEVLAYESEGYSDWYLPSKDELWLMYIGTGNIGDFVSNFYWSSSENDSVNYGWGTNFSNGWQTVTNYSEEYTAYVRPIRAFGYTLGCMDSLACNYNPEANMSDASCEYAEQGYDCDGNEITQYQVGDLAEGGIVFYVDETGEHGLVAAMEDLTEGATDPNGFGFNGYEWGCMSEDVSGADGQDLGTGYQNTMDIVSQGCVTQNGGITAAQAALDVEVNGYIDWYLPSIDELNEMYNTIGPGGLESNIGGFEISVNSYYWSSSKINNMTAWGVYFDNGDTELSSKNNARSVRIIRAF